MKRRLVLISTCLMLILSLVACGDKEEEKKSKKVENAEKASDQEKSEMVELTIPASFFDEEGMSDINEDMKEDGVKDIKVNEDGSVTYKMNKETHDKLLMSLRQEVDGSIEDILEDKEAYPSYIQITYNEDLTEFQIKVDAASFGDAESFGALSLYAAGGIYQSMNLVPEDQINTKVQFVDKDTGEIIEEGNSAEIGEEYQGN